MTEAQTVTYNLDHVIEILRNGVRRADVFMGIGLNAAEADPAVSHVLSPDNLHHIKLVKTDLSPEEKAHVATEFGKWVRANGLRELIETVSLFLDNLYQPLFAMNRGMDKDGRVLQRPDRLERLGIFDKIDAMSSVLPVSEEDKRMISSMNRMRNCYAHRRGVVGARDLDENADAITVRWNAFEMQLEEPDGNVIPEAELYGKVLEQGGLVQLKVVARTRSFNEGSELVLDKQDLKEICLSALSIGQRMLKTTIEQARDFGFLKEAVDENLNEPKAV
ncbi:hypothetical protein [Breoghania sp.]|uniref:hypothetical protein n=1 Tax=Breoghania sp. TaxID=2065378 RepID=UPI002AA885F2|nr:hypothetical protein [Breoghania sp.]